jgi:predicted DNA-binding transcriptional regulator YafY
MGKLKKHFEEVSIDITPWGFKQKSKEYFKILHQAISENRLVEFSYRSTKGETLKRTVEPMTLIFKTYGWYLFSFCKIRNDFRLFRLSRMNNLEVKNDKFERKEMSFKEYFKTEQIVNPINLVLKFSPQVRTRVEEYFEESEVKFTSDGSMIVSLTYPEDEWVYSTILSFGEFVEVLRPEHVRILIADKAKKMCDVYKHDIMLSQ